MSVINEAEAIPSCVEEALAVAEAELTAAAREVRASETALAKPSGSMGAASTDKVSQAAAADPQGVSEEGEPPCDATPTPEGAVQAVVQIEKGIRKLAGVLRTEVSERWNSAKEALEDTTSTRERIDAACERAHAVLEEITQLRDGAQDERNETDAARREARSFREDARRVKERAETSVAAAAEFATDQAAREAGTVRGIGDPATEDEDNA